MEGGTRSEFVRENSGRVLANLQSEDGEYMRCRFTLISPNRGMKGGGEGRCQLSESGKEITADSIARLDTLREECRRTDTHEVDEGAGVDRSNAFRGFVVPAGAG